MVKDAWKYVTGEKKQKELSDKEWDEQIKLHNAEVEKKIKEKQDEPWSKTLERFGEEALEEIYDREYGSGLRE